MSKISLGSKVPMKQYKISWKIILRESHPIYLRCIYNLGDWWLTDSSIFNAIDTIEF